MWGFTKNLHTPINIVDENYMFLRSIVAGVNLMRSNIDSSAIAGMLDVHTLSVGSAIWGEMKSL